MPAEIRHSIFQGTLKAAENSASSLERAGHEKIVGDCYNIGFGCEPDVQLSLEWYERAANAGNIEAIEAFIHTCGKDGALRHLGEEKYCQWLSQVLLSPFKLASEATPPTSSFSRSHDRLERLLLKAPKISIPALEIAFQEYSVNRTRALRLSNNNEQGVNPSDVKKKWLRAVTAIELNDKRSLEEILASEPQLRWKFNDQDTSTSLLHVAVEHDRANLLRTLVDDHHMDPRVTNAEGLTPLALAVRLGRTSSAMVLVFLGQDVRVRGDIAFMDNAAMGNTGKET